MASVEIYCYQCRHLSWQPASPISLEPQCPRCQSDFVEIRDQADGLGPRIALEDSLGRPDSFSDDAAMGGPMAGGGTGGLGILQQMFQALAGQGAQIAVHGGGAGGFFEDPNNPNSGGFEALLNQIMMDHQPQDRPTAQATRNNLPRRKVPAAADAKASSEYAPSSTCKAGDPCTVCHTEFEAEGQVIQLPCEHCFHENCIIPWLEMHHTCPVCRAQLPMEAGSSQRPEQTNNFNLDSLLPGEFNTTMAAAINASRVAAPPGVTENWPDWPALRQPGVNWLAEQGEDDADLFTDSNDDDSDGGSSEDMERVVSDTAFQSPFNSTIREARGETNEMNALHLPLDPMAPIMAPWMSRLHGNTQAPEVSSGLRVNPDDVAGPSGDSANGPGRTQPPEETARPHHGVEASSSSGRSLMSFWDDNEDDNEEADLAILEDFVNEGQHRRFGFLGMITAPVGQLLRGVWHIGNAALRLLH